MSQLSPSVAKESVVVTKDSEPFKTGAEVRNTIIQSIGGNIANKFFSRTDLQDERKPVASGSGVPFNPRAAGVVLQKEPSEYSRDIQRSPDPAHHPAAPRTGV